MNWKNVDRNNTEIKFIRIDTENNGFRIDSDEKIERDGDIFENKSTGRKKNEYSPNERILKSIGAPIIKYSVAPSDILFEQGKYKFLVLVQGKNLFDLERRYEYDVYVSYEDVDSLNIDIWQKKFK